MLNKSLCPRVRAALITDVEALCHFLHREFPKVTLDSWQRLFDYSWIDEKPNLGFVLTVADEIIGFQGAVYSHQRIGAKSGLVCNLSAWCVVSDYRRWSIAPLMAALRDRSISYTCLTPNTRAAAVLERFGFVRLETKIVVMPPFVNANTLRGHGPRLVSEPNQIRDLVDDAQRRIFDDHAPYGCLQLLLVDGLVCAYLVAKRRTMRGLPVSELLYCSDPTLLLHHLERAKLAILRRHGTLALVADARIIQGMRPRDMPLRLLRKQIRLFRSPIFAAEELHNLYSEVVLLPI